MVNQINTQRDNLYCNGDDNSIFHALISGRLAWVVPTLLLLTHAILLARGARLHSPTLDEPAHMTAGISHWHFGGFELYPVNPPLVRMVAALPVMAAGAKTDWTRFYVVPGARMEFDMGEDFVTANGERSFWFMTLARWVCIPFSLVGGLICFCWARELRGAASGLLALTLWCFSPNILAHGQLITTDASSASLGVAAAYFFWRWLKRPGWRRACLAGLMLGFTELTKMTWIVLLGLWPLLWVIWIVSESDRRQLIKECLRSGLQLALILVVGIYVLNLGYALEGSLTRLRDFNFVSETLQSAGETVEGEPTQRNRFADSWIGAIPVPLPSDYVLGIDLQIADFERSSDPSYLAGEFRERGWWYYYLYALAIKIPLGTWLLLCLAGFHSLVSKEHKKEVRSELILLAPAVTVLLLVSMRTDFNHHMRYVLPIFPFLFVWISQVAQKTSSRAWKSAVSGVLIWSSFSSLSVYPHSLSYFNELVGGPAGGHNHLIGSNIDWGQDLLYLKRWIDDHPEAQPLRLAYYGRFDPAIAGIEYTLPGLIVEQNGKDPESLIEPGWYAISVTLLRGHPRSLHDGAVGWKYFPKGSLAGFQKFQPVARVGYSIYVYRITQENIDLMGQ